MLVPVRCFTCGAVLGGKWVAFRDHQPRTLTRTRLVSDEEARASAKALDAVGARRYCCRMHLLSTVDMMPTIES